MEGNEDEVGRLFSVELSDKTRGNGHKLKKMKFHQKTRKHFFTVRVVKQLEYIAKRGCGVTFCGDTQNPTRRRLGHIALSNPA